MPIKCTYGDLDKLRDQPGRPGLFGKLWRHEFPLPNGIVDTFRVQRFCKALLAELQEYEKQVVALAQKLGTPTAAGSFQIPPENLQEFTRLKAELDAVEVEVQATPLPASTLGKIPLCAAELDAIEKFVGELPPSE